MPLDGKTILLTGGTGSFGQKFTELALRTSMKRLRIFSRGEARQKEMSRTFVDERLRFFIGDVRDDARLERAMAGADIVVHAAALKDVVFCEYNPDEAVKTNILGALNIIKMAKRHGAQVLAISTDKAVHCVNLYGGTKFVAEKLFIQGNIGVEKAIFSAVRYGNVLGSTGSVVPLFLEQKRAGRITITDERMTRFWLTLDAGVMFAINCIGRMKGGEVFVPKIPSMKLTDLADAIAPGVEKIYTGIRPGEKLHECLITAEESRHSIEFDNYYVVEPEFPFWKSGIEGGAALEDGFCYTSDGNTRWMTPEQLKKLISSP